jgi:hypothetical protein
MDKSKIMYVLFGVVLLLLIGLIIYDMLQRGQVQAQTDLKIEELKASIGQLYPKVDSVLEKQTALDSSLDKGLDAVAKGKWKIIEHRTEVRDEISTIAGAAPIPDADLAERNRAVNAEFDQWLVDHYGAPADFRGRAPQGTDALHPQKPGEPDPKPEPVPR